MRQARPEIIQMWPWLSRRILVAWFLAMLAMSFGVLAIAAAMTIDCRNEPVYLELEEGGGHLLLVEGGSALVIDHHRECRLRP